MHTLTPTRCGLRHTRLATLTADALRALCRAVAVGDATRVRWTPPRRLDLARH